MAILSLNSDRSFKAFIKADLQKLEDGSLVPLTAYFETKSDLDSLLIKVKDHLDRVLPAEHSLLSFSIELETIS